MKVPPLRYCRPESLSDAIDVMAQYGDDARLLAGGQSLIPSLALRLSAPAVLVDISRVPELQGISETARGLRVGSMVRHKEVELSPLVRLYAPLLSEAMPLVAHPPIRARGTFGGSLALADPAAEAPAATLAHGATLIAYSRSGERRIAAENFFQGLYFTDLQQGEILLGAEFPRPRAGERYVIRELSRRSGDFATVGIAARAHIENGRLIDARIVLFGVADRPTIATETASVLMGNPLSEVLIEKAVQVVCGEISPFADMHHSEATKQHLMGVLLRRVLKEIWRGTSDA